jgi:hypothetical protein
VRNKRLFGILVLAVTWAGCGTTRWSDSARTATEQLLITDSIDRAVSRMDTRALAGKKVFVDETAIKGMTDSAYLLSSIRQHLLASGAILKDKRETADYIVEIRAGAVGTDHHDVLFGVPATQLPTIATLGAAPAQIPEIPFVKKTDQRGVAKISVFAYNRETGRPVWQSGAIPEESRVKAVWFFGAGPFRKGNIDKGMTFAGDRVHIPLIDPMLAVDHTQEAVSVADEAFFVEPKEPPESKPSIAKEATPAAKGQAAVAPASGTPPAGAAAGAAPPNGGQQAAAPQTPAPNQPPGSTGAVASGMQQPAATSTTANAMGLPRPTRSGFWSRAENDFASVESALSVPETPPSGSTTTPAPSNEPTLFGENWFRHRR